MQNSVNNSVNDSILFWKRGLNHIYQYNYYTYFEKYELLQGSLETIT